MINCPIVLAMLLNDFIYCGRRSMSVIYYFLTTMDDNFETKGVRRNVATLT
jgi:hypothetical protein